MNSNFSSTFTPPITLKMFMKKIFFIACAALVAQNAFAQKVWSLKECVDYALQNNISVKQSEISSLVSETNQTQSFFNFFPSLNGSGSYSTNSGRSVDPTSYQFTTSTIQSGNVSINSSVTVF